MSASPILHHSSERKTISTPSEHHAFNTKPHRLQVPQMGVSSQPNPYEQRFHSEWAFVSLILSIFGLLLPPFSTLAIISGIAGLMQIHREKMKGRWMAVIGIVFGFLGILVAMIGVLWGIAFLQEYWQAFQELGMLMGALP